MKQVGARAYTKGKDDSHHRQVPLHVIIYPSTCPALPSSSCWCNVLSMLYLMNRGAVFESWTHLVIGAMNWDAPMEPSPVVSIISWADEQVVGA